MTQRWEREALAQGWRPPAEPQPWVAPLVWTAAAFAVGLGAAYLWWEQWGRRLVRAEAIASLPPPSRALPPAAPASDPAPTAAEEDDQLEALASEVSVAALTDGEATDPTAAPAETATEPAPKPRARRKKPEPPAAEG